VTLLAALGTLALATSAASARGAENDDARWVRETLAGLTLEQKVGQLVMPRLDGGFQHRDHPQLVELEEAARGGRIGGVVVFAGDPRSTAAAVARLQRASAVPLLVASDYEWGAAMRLDGATRFPRAMAAGAAALGWGLEETRTLVREMGAITAREARAVGVQVVLAPVLDLAGTPESTVIGTRAFAADPGLVGALGAAFVAGVQGEGAIAVLKHFPGHGATGVDSHHELPVVSLPGGHLRERDLAPFRAVFETGAGAVMVAHVAYPGLDGRSDRPASRSPVILDSVLRDELQFGGLVVADALDMEGAAGTWDGAVAVESLAAGVDLLLVPPDPRVAWDAVVRAVRRGELTEERVDEAVQRVLEAKARLGLTRSSAPEPAETGDVVGDSRSGAVARAIAERALTLVFDPESVLPLSSRSPPPVLLVSLVDSRDRSSDQRPLADELRRRTAVLEHRVIPLSDHATTTVEVLEPSAASRDATVVVADFAHHRAGGREPIREWIGSLVERGIPVSYVALADPWVLREVPPGVAALATYDASQESQRALARGLFGEIALGGRLPVGLDDERPPGHGHALPRATGCFDRSHLLAERRAPGFDFGPVVEVLEGGIADGAMPGAVAMIGFRGELVLAVARGRTSWSDDVPQVRADTLYDLASLTKVVATTTLAMLEVERGRLDLEASIAAYLPELRGGDKEAIRVADLLAHSSGILWWTDLYRRVGAEPADEAKRRALEEVFALPLESAPGTATVYSDLGILLLGEILERLSGLPLDGLARGRIFDPLGMTETRYRPGLDLLPRIAPTENDPWRGRVVHGEVHDENAAALGGVAPHAGLFSTAGDLAVFAQFLLDGGVSCGARLLRGDTVELFTSRAERVPGSSRALGWDTPSEQSSAGRYFSDSSFGHTGYTGTSLWLDPERDLFAILLTNRVHPTRDNRKLIELRPRFHEAVVRSLFGDAVEPRPGRTVTPPSGQDPP
jgi:beta-N-acetylhexosaminidase